MNFYSIEQSFLFLFLNAQQVLILKTEFTFCNLLINLESIKTFVSFAVKKKSCNN